MAPSEDRPPEPVTNDPAAAPPPARTARWAALATLVVVAGLIAVLIAGVARSNDEAVAASPLDGKPAPALAGSTLDGRRFDLADLRGSWVVVNFFATWCVACVQEHPELVEFSRRHAGAGDRYVVSVVFDDSESDVAEFFARRGGDWPVVVAGSDTAAVDWAVARVPESIIVAPNGVVVAKALGGVRADDLDQFMDGIEARAAPEDGAPAEGGDS